jgi:hypothetical protein
MQLLNTNVAHEENACTVEFIGEGGEVVSVRLELDARGLDDETAIDRAKVMMVQLTTFDDRPAVNEYDALSNGNFDQGVSDPLAVIPDAPSLVRH